MITSELLGIGTAACIAFSGMVATSASRRLGAVAFTRLRMMVAFVLMAAAAFVFNLWDQMDFGKAAVLVVSGAVGIVIGGTVLFAVVLLQETLRRRPAL